VKGRKSVLRGALKAAGLLILFAVFSFWVKAYVLDQDSLDTPAFRLDWVLCSRYMDEGRLYAGQPYCPFPPVFTQVINLVLGAFGAVNLSMAIFALCILATLTTYLLLERVAAHYVPDYSKGAMLLLFLFLVPAATTHNFETASATTFLAAGFYLLRCRKEWWGEYAAGFMFYLSIMHKMLTLPLIGLIVLHHVYVSWAKFKGGRLKVMPTSKGAGLVAAMALPTLVTAMSFENFMAYNFSAHADIVVYTVSEYLSVLSPFSAYFSKQHIVMYVSAAYLAYLLFKNRDILSLLAFSSVVFLLRHIMTGSINIIHGFYYSVPFNIFIILVMLREFKDASGDMLRRSAAVAAAAILLCYGSPMEKVYPFGGWLGEEKAQLEHGLKYALGGSGRILTGYGNKGHYEILWRGLGEDISSYEFDYLRPIPTAYGMDPFAANRLKNLGIVKDISKGAEENITPEEMRMFEGDIANNAKIMERLKEGRYDMILVSPPDYPGLIEAMPEFEGYGYNCSVALPDTYYIDENTVHVMLVKFKDQERCKDIRSKVVDYYTKKLPEICAKSRSAAANIKDKVLPLNKVGIKLDLDGCAKENPYYRGGISAWELFILAVVILAAELAVWYAGRATAAVGGSRRRRKKG
jgi:hypothetical protein